MSESSQPPSPYGPVDPSRPTPPQPQPQPQPHAMFYPPQEPYGYTVAKPTPPKRGNGPGLAALIIGILAVVIAVIPFVNFFAFLLGPIGLIVGIVGLALAGRPRRMAAWGTILSAVSIVLACVLIIVYTFGAMILFPNVVEDPTVDSQSASSQHTDAPS